MAWLQKDSGRVRAGDTSANQGHRTRIAIDAVVSDVNLVALILAGNVGPSGFVAASLVCKAWLSVCREDERVLRGLAAYHGGLTKGVFVKLFAISSQEADALPRAKHLRFGGGHYFLYRADAVDAVLAVGGIKEKAIAAKRSGIDTIILPIDNKKDFDELDENIKEGMAVHYADYYRDVYDIAFGEADKAPRTL